VPDARTAWLSVTESLRDFRGYEWAPFGWILAAQLLFLFCAVNLGTPWGMAGAGWLAMSAAKGDAFLHYPQFFVALPTIAALVEWALYVFAGAVLIPMAVLRISEPHEPPGPRATSSRLRRAILPTLLGGLLNLVVLQAWQWVLSIGPEPMVRGYLPGPAGQISLWCLGVLVSYVLSGPFLFIPVHAIRRQVSFAQAVFDGLGQGVRLIWPAFLVIAICSWPTLLFLAPVQLGAAAIVHKMRPELVVLFLALYAATTSLANYLIYASVTRLHWADQV
jgi:hypothetical protein